jgi:hypothetical protein
MVGSNAITPMNLMEIASSTPIHLTIHSTIHHNHRMTMFSRPCSTSPQVHHVSRPWSITTSSPRFPSMHYYYKLTTFPVHAASPQTHHISPSMHNRVFAAA